MKKTKEKEEPAYMKLYREDQMQELEQALKVLDIRERLLAQVKLSSVDVSFNDKAGQFKVKCRILTDSEQRRILKLQENLAKIKSTADYENLINELYDMLAYPDGICQEPSLTKEFWRSGEFGTTVPLQIIADVLSQTNETMQQVSKFRKNKTGANPAARM